MASAENLKNNKSILGYFSKPGSGIGKYVLFGMAAMLTTATVMAGEVTPPASTHSAVYEAEATQHIHHSQDLGYLGHNIAVHANVFQKNVSNDYLAQESLREQTNHSYPTIGGECEVTVTFSQDGRAPFLGFTEDLYKMTAPQTHSQQELLREAVELHEASHCEFNHFATPILVHDNPDLEKKMNYYFSYGFSNENGVSGIKTTLNETFADTYALIQMIKIHGDSADMQWLFKSMASQREEMTLKNGRKDNLESHSSQFAIEELMRPDIKEMIAKTDNPEQLKQLALEISNHSVQKLYHTYDKLGENAYSITVMKNGLEFALYDALVAEKKASQSDTVRAIAYNGEHTIAQDLLPELLKRVHAKGVTGDDIHVTEDRFKLDQKTNQILTDVIDDVVSEKMMANNRQMRLDEFSVVTDYNKYIKNHSKAYVGDYASSDMPVAEFATKVVDIRTNFATNNMMAQNDIDSSNVKTDIVNKIAQMRQNSFSSTAALATTLTVK
jgi:hypothetical protein